LGGPSLDSETSATSTFRNPKLIRHTQRLRADTFGARRGLRPGVLLAGQALHWQACHRVVVLRCRRFKHRTSNRSYVCRYTIPAPAKCRIPILRCTPRCITRENLGKLWCVPVTKLSLANTAGLPRLMLPLREHSLIHCIHALWRAMVHRPPPRVTIAGTIAQLKY
jgi:hypothetical protein